MSSALSRGRDCGRGNDALQLGTHDCTRPECGGVRARTIAAATAAARAAASLVVASAKRQQRLPRERWRRWSYYVIYVFFSFRFCCFFQPIDRAVAARPRTTVPERCDPVVVAVYRFYSLRHNHNNNNILLMLCSSFVRSYPHPSPKTVMITTMIVLMIILLSYTIYDIYNNNILTLTIIKKIVSRRRLRKIANTLKYSIHQLSLYTIVILL